MEAEAVGDGGSLGEVAGDVGGREVAETQARRVDELWRRRQAPEVVKNVTRDFWLNHLTVDATDWSLNEPRLMP